MRHVQWIPARDISYGIVPNIVPAHFACDACHATVLKKEADDFKAGWTCMGVLVVGTALLALTIAAPPVGIVLDFVCYYFAYKWWNKTHPRPKRQRPQRIHWSASSRAPTLANANLGTVMAWEKQHQPAISKLAVASIALSITGWSFLPIVGAILGVIFGHIALNHVKKSQGLVRGREFAIAGLWIGYVNLGLFVSLVAIALPSKISGGY